MNAVENTVDIPVIPDSEKYVESVLESTFLNSVLALQESLNVIDCAVIKSVAYLFINKFEEARIFIAGCGGSSAICDDFNHKLLKLVSSHQYLVIVINS